jgi:restriction endonuclease S subunit
VTDVNQLITEHLGIWTTATEKKSSAGRGSGGGISQYGVSKLRQLIMELAVRGSLVPQFEADGNAYEQLAKVAADKRRALKQGQIKSVRGLIDEPGSLGFGVPENWATVRLDSIAWPQAGFAFKSKGFNTVGTGLPLIRIRDVGKEFSGTFFSGDHRTEFVVENGDYLISMDGEFRVCPWTNGPALLNQRVSRLVFFSELVSPKFVSLALQFELSALQGVKAYTTVDHLSTKQIANASLPFPPVAEQQRIVDKVDELMGLCDALERQAADSLKAHQTLVETCLATLTNSQSPEDLTQNWTRIEAHFDTLFTTEESIESLVQALLKLIYSGLLSSKPGKKAEMAKIGTYRKLQNGYAFKSGTFQEDGIRLLRNINIGHDQIDWTETVCLSFEAALEFKRFELNYGDIVLTLDRPFISTGTKVARIQDADLPSLLLQRVGRFIVTSEGLDDDYLFLWLNSELFKSRWFPAEVMEFHTFRRNKLRVRRSLFLPSKNNEDWSICLL